MNEEMVVIYRLQQPEHNVVICDTDITSLLTKSWWWLEKFRSDDFNIAIMELLVQYFSC